MSTNIDPNAPDEGAAAAETLQQNQEPSGVLGDLAAAARKSVGKTTWMGAAVGIGSAAIVAALLYTNKKRG